MFAAFARLTCANAIIKSLLRFWGLDRFLIAQQLSCREIQGIDKMRVIKWLLFTAVATVVFYHLMPEQQRAAQVTLEQRLNSAPSEAQRPTSVRVDQKRQSSVLPEQRRPTSLLVESGRSAKPEFNCDGRQYCSQMTSCKEATQFLRNCPGMKMDGNRDGVPCEKQWCR